MVEYFGKHSCKQAIRNKPIRFGYKVWCQNTTSGYLITFNPYKAKTYKKNFDEKKQFGRFQTTILHLLNQYSADKAYLPYLIIIHNFASFQRINMCGYEAVGMIRSNRKSKSFIFMDVKNIDKKDGVF